MCPTVGLAIHTFPHSIEDVFAVLSDPVAWSLCLTTMERIDGRPAMPGTKWRFDNHEYTCQEAIPPRLLSFRREDLEIEYRLSSSEPGSTDCRVDIRPAKLLAPISFFAKRELELLTKLQSLLDTPQGCILNRISMESLRGATKNGATIEVTTTGLIRKSASEVFSLLVDPRAHSRWMIERHESDELAVSPEWPQVGSSFRYREQPKSAFQHMQRFIRRDWNTVLSLDLRENYCFESEERQLGATLRSAHKLESVSSAST
jgi:uncharacterized protein YndB with AHSA1/START domain